MIPNEAVEAAWAEVEAGVLPTKADIQRILEAAAPYMLAGVWQDGATDGHLYGIYQPVAGPDRFPQAMIEGSTEYDWAELPEGLKDIMRNAAKEFAHWADSEHAPLKGELATELINPYRSQA